MLAAFYTRTGPAREVLHVGELETPEAGPGEVRVRLAMSGVNPSDVKTRGGVRSRDLPFPRIVPHSDGAGVIDQAGDGVPPARIGERVWVWNAAWGRPNGTAAQFVVLPAQQAVPLPPDASFEAGACLGIPALTAYHAVHCAAASPARRCWSPAAPAPSATMRSSLRRSPAPVASSRPSAARRRRRWRATPAPTWSSTTGPTTSRSAASTSPPERVSIASSNSTSPPT